jgi:hypothetical protein
MVLDRIAAAQVRARLGRPVAEQVRARSASPAARLRPMTIVGVLVATASAVAILLSAIQGTALLGAAGGIGCIAGGLLAWRRQRRSVAPVPPEAGPLFDDVSLQALDRVEHEVALEVPEHIAAQLAGFNQLIVRLARHGAVAVDAEFTIEDRMYLTECVRRYLPDTLQSYLAVPRNQRTAKLLEDGQSAQDLLESQLDLLRAELQRREAKLARSAAEQLLRQQRFLSAKKTS